MYLFKLRFSLGICPGLGLLGYYGNSIFSFLWSLLTVFHHVGTSLHSYQQCRSIPFFPRTCLFFYILFILLAYLLNSFFLVFQLLCLGFIGCFLEYFLLDSLLVPFYFHCLYTLCYLFSYLKWLPSASIQYLKTVGLRGANHSMASISWCSEAYSIDNGRTLSLLHHFPLCNLFSGISSFSVSYKCEFILVCQGLPQF